MPLLYSEKSLQTLQAAIQMDIDKHQDNPQLLLFIAIKLGDMVEFKRLLSHPGINPNAVITNRNTQILAQLGINT